MYALRTGGVSFTGARAATDLGRGAVPAETGHMLIDTCQSTVCEMGKAAARRFKFSNL